MLALEVEFLSGVSVAATPNRREEAEWPPHPDRLFQALVAAWCRNETPREDERAALEWLERLDPEGLAIQAPAASRRDVATVFVPPNDVASVAAGAKRKERAFPAAVPLGDPVVRYVWRTAEGIGRHRDALLRLIREVTYLGHSHSPVRLALVDPATVMRDQDRGNGWLDEASSPLRIPYPGRLSHLVARYADDSRPAASLAVRTFARPGSQPAVTAFDDANATVFADAGGFVPALEAFPAVAKRLRDALLAHSPEGIPIPALLSGHDVAGKRTDEPHLAVIPLADIGWRHSQGRLMAIAIVWPRYTNAPERAAALRAVVAFARAGAGELHFGSSGTWKIGLTPAPDRASLDMRRYVGPARTWATVLPAVLDRHPKDGPGADLATIVLGACLNVGLTAQAIEGLEIEAGAYPCLTGAPSVRDVGRLLPLDSPYRGRPLRHLRLRFPVPIEGPLLLGAGRFRGLGLCMAIDVADDR